MPRNLKQPFARRITLAFTLMTCIVSGVLSLCIVLVIHFLEQEIILGTLDETMNRVLVDDYWQGKAPRLNTDTRLFVSDDPEYAIPAQFSQAREGFSEVLNKDGSYWVYARHTGERRYLLVQDQSEFESHEQTLLHVLFAGFLLTVASAYVLGKISAKKVMAPIRRLAEQVRCRDPLQPTTPLVEDYADDEIGRLAAAFDKAMRSLGLALERERLVTSDVSHELRTPLTVIATSCELLEAAQPTERERLQINRIARAAAEMRELTETFLMLARGPSEQTASDYLLQENACTLQTAAAEQYLKWQTGFYDKRLRFEIIEKTPNSMRYNATLLRVVMGNLLRNALYYTEQGWVRLILEHDGFRVEDSGIGISEQEKEQVFQAFTRGEEARGEGLGLGLSIVKRTCAHQGWTITLNSLPEGGSSFCVKLCQ